MASINKLPSHLKEHARRVPPEVFSKLHQGEAWHRLQYVHDKLRAAESLPAEQYRHVTRQAKRELEAMPNAQYVQEHKRLEGLEHDATGNREIAHAWYEARTKLERDHPQVKGVQEAIMDYDKANPENVSKAVKPKPAVSKAVQKAIDQAAEDYWAKVAELRKEIAQVRERLNGGN